MRLTLTLLIVTVTIALFAYYLSTHGSLWQQLKHTPPSTIIILFGLFALWFLSLGMILQAALRICNVRVPFGENLALNAYSTTANYFLPGQSGPILRALYLKGRYKVPLGRYLLSMIIYYAFYAVVSMLFLVVGVRAWWQSLIGVLAVGATAYFFVRYYARRKHISPRGLNLSVENLAFMFLATCLQAVCQVAIYWVELSNVAHGLQMGQVLSYTGAADFAIFVSITPGAIGIREAFLLFSERLHHIADGSIVGANLLDRSIYILFLIVVLGIIFALGSRKFVSMRSVVRHEEETEPPTTDEGVTSKAD